MMVWQKSRTLFYNQGSVSPGRIFFTNKYGLLVPTKEACYDDFVAHQGHIPLPKILDQTLDPTSSKKII